MTDKTKSYELSDDEVMFILTVLNATRISGIKASQMIVRLTAELTKHDAQIINKLNNQKGE